MKAFVFIAYILVTVTLVYGFDVQFLQSYYSTAAICTDHLQLPRNVINPKIVECLLNQYNLLDEMGIMKMNEATQNLHHLISSPISFVQAQQLLQYCSNYGAAGDYPHERIVRLSECLVPIVQYLDKP